MSGNCPERFDLSFLKWVWNFNKEYRNKYLNMLDKLENKEIYILKSRREIKELLEII